MEVNNRTKIKVETKIEKPVEIVWKKWTSPDDIIRWNAASDDWHTTRAENDLKTGGQFLSRMEAKDGSMGFDFQGVYENVKVNELIEYIIGDGRKVKVEFNKDSGSTKVTETFEAEDTNPIDMQRSGWQSILNNFKKYVESAS